MAGGTGVGALPGEIGTTWASKLAAAAGVGSDAAAIALQILAGLIFASLAYVFIRRSRTNIG